MIKSVLIGYLMVFIMFLVFGFIGFIAWNYLIYDYISIIWSSVPKISFWYSTLGMFCLFFMARIFLKGKG